MRKWRERERQKRDPWGSPGLIKAANQRDDCPTDHWNYPCILQNKNNKNNCNTFYGPNSQRGEIKFLKKSDQDILNVSIYKSNQKSAQELRVKKHQNPSLNERRKFTIVKTWFSLSFFYTDVNIMLVYVRSLKGGLAFGQASHMIIRRYKGPILCRIHLT